MNEHYTDKEAAKDVNNGRTKKDPLTESPFIRQLEYGANKEGYWTGNHMIVQFEDVVDCLKVKFGDKYDYVFQYDHSSGHAKSRLFGLDETKMTKGWGGILQHESEIKEVGKYHDASNTHMVKVGEKQQMNWEGDLPDDAGPYYLTVQERKDQKYDRVEQLPEAKWKTKNKTREELADEILALPGGQVAGKCR